MQLSFSIKSSTHYLVFLRRLVSVFNKINQDIKLDHKAVMSCQLALVEAVNNAIFHAHKGDYSKWIDINIQSMDDTIKVEVFDEGSGFEMPDYVDPPLDETHGRGLFIMKSVMNKVEYKRGSRNVLRMIYMV